MDLATYLMMKKSGAGGGGGFIPRKVSDLENDANYVTAQNVGALVSAQTANLADQLAGKQEALTFDETPAANSANPVKSGGVYGFVNSTVNAAVTQAFAGISQFSLYKCGAGEYDAVTLLPTVASPDSAHIYLVPDGGNYREYVRVNGVWDLIGTTDIDLSGYVQTADLANYVLRSELPAVPEKVSELYNDAGFITNPRTAAVTLQPADQTGASGTGGIVGGTQVWYEAIIPSQETAEAIKAVCESPDTVYLNTNDNPQSTLTADDTWVIACNIRESVLSPAPMFGVDIVDPDAPMYIISLSAEPTSETGYLVGVTSNVPMNGAPWRLFYEGRYLTQHQSLAGYARNSALKQVAFSGSYSDLANKPVIPTKTSQLTNNSGFLTQHQSLENVNAAKINGYTVVVQSAAPAAGTPDTQITIVV